MIVELFGLPGSGKSSLMQRIQGRPFVEAAPERGLKSALLRAAKRMAPYMPSSLALKREMRIAIGATRESPEFISASVKDYVNNLCMVAFGYRHAGGRTLYMDEGIVHRVVSFAVNYDLSIEKMLRLLDAFRSVVYLDTDMEECLRSIQRRNRHICKMDELDDAQLRRFLNRYRKYFDAINERYAFPRVTRENYEEIEKIIR